MALVTCAHCHRRGPWRSFRLRFIGIRLLCDACREIGLIAELVVE